MAQKKLSGSQKFFMKLFFPPQKAFFPKLFFSTRGIQHFVSLKVRWVLAQSQNKLTLKLLFSEKRCILKKNSSRQNFAPFSTLLVFPDTGFFLENSVFFFLKVQELQKKSFLSKVKKIVLLLSMFFPTLRI